MAFPSAWRGTLPPDIRLVYGFTAPAREFSTHASACGPATPVAAPVRELSFALGRRQYRADRQSGRFSGHTANRTSGSRNTPESWSEQKCSPGSGSGKHAARPGQSPPAGRWRCLSNEHYDRALHDTGGMRRQAAGRGAKCTQSIRRDVPGRAAAGRRRGAGVRVPSGDRQGPAGRGAAILGRADGQPTRAFRSSTARSRSAFWSGAAKQPSAGESGFSAPAWLRFLPRWACSTAI